MITARRTIVDEIAEIMGICKAGNFTPDGAARLLLLNIAKHIEERGLERVGVEIKEAANAKQA